MAETTHSSVSNASTVRSAPRRRTVSSMGTLWTFVVVAAVSFTGALATRGLSDWELGRWWVLEAALVAVAGIASIIGIIVAVAALGEIARHRSTAKGTVAVAIGLLLSGLLLVATATLGRNDWIELDIPAAWDRLELGAKPDTDKVETRSGGVLTYEELRLDSQWGSCYVGPPEEPGKVVDCGKPHRTEVIGSFKLPPHAADATYPGDDELAAVAKPRCQTQVDNKAAGTQHSGTAQALVPPRELWEVGDGQVVCVVFFEEPQTGALGAGG